MSRTLLVEEDKDEIVRSRPKNSEPKTFLTGNFATKEDAVQEALNYASNNGAGSRGSVSVSEGVFPYDISNVTVPENIKLQRENEDADEFNVKAYGAGGEGTTDDTEAITQAIEDANKAGGSVRFPLGDYLITDELPYYSNMIWNGDGQPGSVSRTANVIETEDQGNIWKVVIAENDIVNHKMYDGDPIEFFGFNDDANNGLFSIDDVDPPNNTIFVNNENGVTVSNPSDDAGSRITWKGGGSALRHKRLDDGETFTHGRFIDARGIRNSGLKGLGFIGSGINEVFGGGIRIRRPADRFSSEAISGLKFNDVLVEHIPSDGIEIGQAIFSSFRNMRFERCVGDGFKFAPEDGVGGATTSCKFDTIFFRGCRRGLAAEIFVYCSLDNMVAEGCSIGYYMERAIGCTYNSDASETIKFERAGEGNGITYRFVDSYSNVVNGATVFYNTNLDEWSKGAIEIIDTAKRAESQIADLNHGHIHESVQERIRCVGSEWDGANDEIFWWLDVSNTPAFEPASAADTDGDWLRNSFINEGDMVIGYDLPRDPLFNVPNRYRIDTIDRFNFVASNAVRNSSAPGPNDDSSQGFVEFSETDGVWIDESETPEELGYYVCIDDTQGSAEWIEWQKLWFFQADSRGHNRDYPIESLPNDPQPYVVSVGRQYGADVIADQTFRCAETNVNSNGNLEVWMDVQDFQPTNYITIVNEDPFGGNDTRGFSIQDNHRMTTINGEMYWVIQLIVPSFLEQGHNWSNAWESVSGVETRFDENGIDVTLDVDYVKEEESTGSFLLAIDESQIVTTADTVDVFNPRLGEMEGTYDTFISSPQWEDSNLSSGTHPTIKMTLSANLEPEITRHIDDALIRLSGWDAAPVSEVNMKGFDVPIVYDPEDTIYPGGGRQLEVDFPSGTLEVTRDLTMAEMYNFKAFVPDSFTQVREKSKDSSSFTLERDQDNGDETAIVRAVRKKNPGFEMWRGNPASGGDFSPDDPNQ